MRTHYSAQLAQFATELKLGDIPQSVIARTEDLFVDWFASAIGGKGCEACGDHGAICAVDGSAPTNCCGRLC